MASRRGTKEEKGEPSPASSATSFPPGPEGAPSASATAPRVALAALAVLLAVAVARLPDDAATVSRALTSRALLPAPEPRRFVARRATAIIVDQIEDGREYVIVDGDNRVGKSVAVDAAAAHLSASGRTVLRSEAWEDEGALAVLSRFFGVGSAAAANSAVDRLLRGVVPPLSFSELCALMSSHVRAPAGFLEPIFVVERAELLAVAQLKLLMNLAKELVDMRRGRFIFVFAPAETFDDARSFGAFTRAMVVHVGGLDEAEAAAFLALEGCDAGHAAAVHALVGGHLPHLLADEVGDYCRGEAALADVEGALRADIRRRVDVVEWSLGPGSACSGLCAATPESDAWAKPAVLDALAKLHLVSAGMNDVAIESKLVLEFANASCACKVKGSV